MQELMARLSGLKEYGHVDLDNIAIQVQELAEVTVSLHQKNAELTAELE